MRTRTLLLSIGLAAYAYGQCTLCTANNTLAPRTFDPPYLTIRAGVDTMVVIQFALPETVTAPSINYVYPNFAIFVDSLHLDGGNTYVSLYGQPNVAPAYNSANPPQGALRFDQNHRYKQVRSSAPTHDNVVVYQNPGGGSPSNPTPPRGCVRACVRGIQPTPPNSADTLRILLRGFVDPNSINIFTGQSIDINNKDTTNLMPTLAGNPLYADAWTAYAVVVLPGQTTVLERVLSGVQLSPNPAWGTAGVTFGLHRPAEVTLRVFSMEGKLVWQREMGLTLAGEHTVSLSLPAGLYTVEVQAGPELLRTKLVVLH